MSSKHEDNDSVILVKYKAQSGKGEEAVAGLTQLINMVKHEPHFVTIKLYVDPNDNSNLLLCEEWSNEAYYYSDHMQTPHLQKFMQDSRSFLAGPPEISRWKIKERFRAE